jgi:hypothetical protein
MKSVLWITAVVCGILGFFAPVFWPIAGIALVLSFGRSPARTARRGRLLSGVREAIAGPTKY